MLQNTRQSRCFNSKLVRLEAGIHLENEKFIDGFQFQTGAIRSEIARTIMAEGIKFQFQTGAIRSPIESSY